MVSELQKLSMKTEPAIPLLIAVDQEGGEIASAPWVTPQPSAAMIGRRGDPDIAREAAEVIGGELLQAGVNTDLAPVVDTQRWAKPTRVIIPKDSHLSILRYSPKCVEEEFCELRRYGVLRSS
jgi:beta-glucosidase-like glycosyl hydrolase